MWTDGLSEGLTPHSLHQGHTMQSKLKAAKEYAIKRHKETGRHYLVTSLHQSLLDCKYNRLAVKELDCEVIFSTSLAQ
jgi:hypothetical protein